MSSLKKEMDHFIFTTDWLSITSKYTVSRMYHEELLTRLVNIPTYYVTVH